MQNYMKQKRESGLSARTVQYHHAVLRAALGQAEIWGLVSRNIAKLAKPGKVERSEIQPLTSEQTRKFLSWFKGRPSLWPIHSGVQARTPPRRASWANVGGRGPRPVYA